MVEEMTLTQIRVFRWRGKAGLGRPLNVTMGLVGLGSAARGVHGVRRQITADAYCFERLGRDYVTEFQFVDVRDVGDMKGALAGFDLSARSCARVTTARIHTMSRNEPEPM